MSQTHDSVLLIAAGKTGGFPAWRLPCGHHALATVFCVQFNAARNGGAAAGTRRSTAAEVRLATGWPLEVAARPLQAEQPPRAIPANSPRAGNSGEHLRGQSASVAAVPRCHGPGRNEHPRPSVTLSCRSRSMPRAFITSSTRRGSARICAPKSFIGLRKTGGSSLERSGSSEPSRLARGETGF